MSKIDSDSIVELNDAADTDKVIGYRPSSDAPANRWTLGTLKAHFLSGISWLTTAGRTSAAQARADLGAASADLSNPEARAVIVAKTGDATVAGEDLAVTDSSRRVSQRLGETEIIDPAGPFLASSLAIAWQRGNSVLAQDTANQRITRLSLDADLRGIDGRRVLYSRSGIRYAQDAAGGLELPFAPVSDVIMWGDSLTNGDGGAGTTIASVLQSIRGGTVTRQGFSGRWPSTIRSRFFLAAPVITKARLGLIRSVEGEAGAATIITNGIALKVCETDDYRADECYTWTYDSASSAAAGADVIVPLNNPATGRWLRGSLTTLPANLGTENRVHIFWLGNNNPGEIQSMGYSEMIAHLKSLQRRVLILNLPNRCQWDYASHSGFDTPAQWAAARAAPNAWLANNYGDILVDVQDYLVNRYAPLNADDAADQALGIAPRSLKENADDGDGNNNDGTHFNAAGYTRIAEIVATALTARRW